MAFSRLLGTDTLNSHKGEVPVSSLEGKYVFLYFSAHWCPPCRRFTPILSTFYHELKRQRNDFEIVWCSWDQSPAEAAGYFEVMPWLALPYARRDLFDVLQRQFRVESIPTLILLNSSGQVVTGVARDKVMMDPTGVNFPWSSSQNGSKL